MGPFERQKSEEIVKNTGLEVVKGDRSLNAENSTIIKGKIKDHDVYVQESDGSYSGFINGRKLDEQTAKDIFLKYGPSLKIEEKSDPELEGWVREILE